MIKQLHTKQNFSTAKQLIILFLMILIGLTVSLFITSIIGITMYGKSFIENPQAINNNIGFLKLSQVIQVFFMFFAPSLIYLKHFGNETDYKILLSPKPKSLYIIALLIIIISLPFIEQTAIINNQLKLPESLAGLENWIKSGEKELNELTYRLLIANNTSTIVVNVAIMVFLPAFCEELLFRGVLQNKLTQWMRNGHIAIIITAFIFSAIHMQFLTFLPRFILGIALGYMLFWGQSLWLPVFAHFINNGVALASFYYYQSTYPGINPLEIKLNESSDPIIYISSFVLFIALLLTIKPIHKKVIMISN
ncbi:MAG: CPBP family intramembrane metalloprotease [Marinilabiliaceae bacterium]|nr:CPBP family intramembrane metalloprotease [Marinilabiliaceae bacterium]